MKHGKEIPYGGIIIPSGLEANLPFIFYMLYSDPTNKENHMFKFTLGLTSGLALGAFGTMILAIIGVIALEDSPEMRETFKDALTD
jgi:hypothetical protein